MCWCRFIGKREDDIITSRCFVALYNSGGVIIMHEINVSMRTVY